MHHSGDFKLLWATWKWFELLRNIHCLSHFRPRTAHHAKTLEFPGYWKFDHEKHNSFKNAAQYLGKLMPETPLGFSVQGTCLLQIWISTVSKEAAKLLGFHWARASDRVQILYFFTMSQPLATRARLAHSLTSHNFENHFCPSHTTIDMILQFAPTFHSTKVTTPAPTVRPPDKTCQSVTRAVYIACTHPLSEQTAGQRS